jgi:hypothetical protein
MVGHKLGEFSPTRVFKGHAGNKKAVSKWSTRKSKQFIKWLDLVHKK